jgi:uncharacterized membrane protein
VIDPLAASAPAVPSERLSHMPRIGSLSGGMATSLPAAASMAAGLAATGWVAVLLVGRVDGLSAPPYDLAFFQQVIWNIGHSGAWVSSFHEGTFLGLHFSPVLVIPALVERLAGGDVRILSMFHAVLVGALAPAAFLFLRAAFRPSRAADALAAGIAIPIPIWGAMQDVIRSDFHPEAAGVVLALLAGWAGMTGRMRAMWLLAIVALATREDTAYAVAVIGLVVAARSRGAVWRNAWALTAFAGLWAVMVFGVVMPWLRDGATSDTSRYYAWLGGGLGVLGAPFTMTDRVVAALTRPGAWFVLVGMAAALLGLPLLRPRWAVLVLPPLIAMLLSAHWFQAAARLQYSLILVVPLLAAAAFGGRRAIAIADRVSRRWRDRRRADAKPPAIRSAVAARTVMVAILVAVPGIAGAWVQGSLPPFDVGDPAFFHRPASIDRVRLVAKAVPASALLLTDDGLVAAVSDRSAVGRLGATTLASDDAYVLADRLAWAPTSRIGHQHDETIDVLDSSSRPILYDDGRFVLWGPVPEEGLP